MRNAILLFLLLLSFILPGTVFHFLSWSGIKPDLTMLLIIYIAFDSRRWSAILWGVGSGLVLDLYLGRYLGMYTFTLTVVAILSHWLAERWYRDNFFLTTVLVFFITAVGQLIVAFLNLGAGLLWSFADIVRLVTGVAFYNAILVPVTYPLIHRSFVRGWLRYRPKYER